MQWVPYKISDFNEKTITPLFFFDCVLILFTQKTIDTFTDRCIDFNTNDLLKM